MFGTGEAGNGAQRPDVTRMRARRHNSGATGWAVPLRRRPKVRADRASPTAPLQGRSAGPDSIAEARGGLVRRFCTSRVCMAGEAQRRCGDPDGGSWLNLHRVGGPGRSAGRRQAAATSARDLGGSSEVATCADLTTEYRGAAAEGDTGGGPPGFTSNRTQGLASGVPILMAAPTLCRHPQRRPRTPAFQLARPAAPGPRAARKSVTTTITTDRPARAAQRWATPGA